MIKDSLHHHYCKNENELVRWFCDLKAKLQIPLYSSYDIRDSGHKVSNVDANIYPAGFNNICPTDKENSVEIFDEYFREHYGAETKKILLVTEEHTNNPYYWDNVYTIQDLLSQTGRQVMVVLPRRLEASLTVTSAAGHELTVHGGYGDSAKVVEFGPDLIVSNNDFSNEHLEWAASHNLPINPPRELGWYQRQKSRYFHHYNALVEEFASISKIDPFLLNVRTEVFDHFDIGEELSLQRLAARVDQALGALRHEYSLRGLHDEPFVFVKNNSGTYGLAVIRVGSGAEVLDWNYKSRKKMKAAKGGRQVEEVIIQEGISTRVTADGATAEPVIYMIGDRLAGGFLRTHAEKDSSESLNSPGAVYKRLCVSDLNVTLLGHPNENVYGWSARLGALAIGLEAKEMGVQFKGYRPFGC